MSTFMNALLEFIQRNPKIFNELNENLFKLDPNNQNDNSQEQILKHPIKKQIFSIGEIIDEVTDSSFQNIIQVLDYYNLRNLNPAVISVSYANMRVLEKSGGAVNDVPKLSFIQLGLQQQELNKHLIFFNAFQHQQSNLKKDQLTNIQYISMYHQESIKNEDSLVQPDSQQKSEGNETLEQNQNCFEIAINEYLNKQDGQNVKFEELFVQNQQKCPKIIGQSEFLFLFESVLRLVRYHKPSYIILSYDFSLTKSHNHYYNLKPDVLGYFCYMLSQISNNHVIFVANTKDENHFLPKQLEQLISQQDKSKSNRAYQGFDCFDNTTNYLSVSKEKQLEKFQELKGELQKFSETPQDTEDKTQLNQDQKAEQQDATKKNNIIGNAGRLTSTYSQVAHNSQNQIFTLHTSAPSSDIKTKINKFINWIRTEPSQPEYQKYLTYFFDKFYCDKYIQQKDQIKISVQQVLLANKNLYQNIQEQLNSIFFSLFETINYRKIILKQNLKTAIHVQVQFMSSITEQIRRSVMPIKSQANQESLKGIQKVKWTLQQIKIHDYVNKIKQIKHISDFVSHSNGEKVNLLQKFSKQNKYTNTPKPEGGIEEEIKANSESMIINVMQKYPENSEMCTQTLVSELKQDDFDKLYSDQLKVKIMLKRYTQALLNNWVYDLRRKKKIYLHILNLQDKVDQELKFFYTEHSQYVIDYNYDSQNEDQNSNQIAIYFFNVQRGKHFKNYVFTEVKENQFIQEEIKYSVPKVLDINWKSISPFSNPSNATTHYHQTTMNQNQLHDPTRILQNQQTSMLENTVTLSPGRFLLDQNYERHIHQENLLDLEIFNSSLCITDQFIVKMFGEVINPTTWKQKEFSKMIFIVPRKQKSNSSAQNNKELQLKLLEPFQQENFIFNPLPRSGCVCVYQKEEKAEKIFVFGGISYNGYLCNFIEEYAVDNQDQQLLFIKVNYKKLAQKTFRPLFSPFTFTYNQNVYFLGGEIDKNLILRGFNQVYLQQYSLKDSQFKYVQQLKRKEIISKLNLTSMDQKQHQKEFLKFAEIIPFYAVNLNTYFDEKNQNQYIALLGKCNSAIEQILEKTTVIEVQLENLVASLDPAKQLQPEKYIKIETSLEDEKQQELRLNEHNSSKTFFLSSFQADQSQYMANQNRTNEQQRQSQANFQSVEGQNQQTDIPKISTIKDNDQTKILKSNFTAKDYDQTKKILNNYQMVVENQQPHQKNIPALTNEQQQPQANSQSVEGQNQQNNIPKTSTNKDNDQKNKVESIFIDKDNEKTKQFKDIDQKINEKTKQYQKNIPALTNEQQRQPQANSQSVEGQNQQSNIVTTSTNKDNINSNQMSNEKKQLHQKNIPAKTEEATQYQNKKQLETQQQQSSTQLEVESQSTKKLENLIAKQDQGSQQAKNKQRNFKDLVEIVNFQSKGLKLEFFSQDVGIHEMTGKQSYLKPVNQDYFYIHEDKQIPKYFLVQNYFGKIINILQGDNSQNQFQIVPKFQLTIRFNDEDFKDSLLSNQMHFLSYYLKMEKKICVFYKTLSLEECTELSQSYPNFKSFDSIFKFQIKFDQQKFTILSLQDEYIDTNSQNLVNRYILCDQEYIYLLNGAEQKDTNIPYNKLQPCERVNIKTKLAENISDCIYLDCKKSQILQSSNYIFYIGLYENQEEQENEDDQMETEKDGQNEESEVEEDDDDDEDDDEQSEQLIAQIFDKKQKVWRVIRLSKCKEIKNKFNTFTFLLGNQENKLFAINTKFNNKKKDSIANHELTFDLNTCHYTQETHHLPFNWKAQKQVEIIRSQHYSATAYAILPTNPVTYSIISLIPKKYYKM
ncbi:hypothetical protein ABPG72_010384 [Tetrahymena utriculariae]